MGSIAQLNICMNIITITDAAKAHFIHMMKQEKQACLTVSLTQSGCNGQTFSYDYKPGKKDSMLIILNPDANPDTDIIYEFFVDADAVPFMLGAVIDYVTNGIFNSRITYDLPLAKGECGCGKSINF